MVVTPSGISSAIGQPPTHDLAAVPVNDRSQVHVATFHPDVGDVDRPHLIRELSHITPEQVWQDSFLIVALREVWPGIDRVDSHLPHVAAAIIVANAFVAVYTLLLVNSILVVAVVLSSLYQSDRVKPTGVLACMTADAHLILRDLALNLLVYF